MTTALAMKSAGTLIYSIGIFEGANPEQQSFGNRENDQANQFMHAVSSNYPNATAYDKANGLRAATSATTRPPTALTT